MRRAGAKLHTKDLHVAGLLFAEAQTYCTLTCLVRVVDYFALTILRSIQVSVAIYPPLRPRISDDSRGQPTSEMYLLVFLYLREFYSRPRTDRTVDMILLHIRKESVHSPAGRDTCAGAQFRDARVR